MVDPQKLGTYPKSGGNSTCNGADLQQWQGKEQRSERHLVKTHSDKTAHGGHLAGDEWSCAKCDRRNSDDLKKCPGCQHERFGIQMSDSDDDETTDDDNDDAPLAPDSKRKRERDSGGGAVTEVETVDLCEDSEDDCQYISDGDGAESEDSDVEVFKNEEQQAMSDLTQAGFMTDKIEDDIEDYPAEEGFDPPMYPDFPHFRCIEEVQKFTDIDFGQFRAKSSDVMTAYKARQKKRKGEPPTLQCKSELLVPCCGLCCHAAFVAFRLIFS
jgi:hypothetical protein